MYTAVTWAELRERLKDSWEGKPFWDDDEALEAFNEGMQVFNLLTGRWKRRETLPTVANQYLYTLPASMLRGTRATVNLLPLSPTSRVDLNNSRANWRAETTLSGGDVPTRPLFWAPVSLRSFYLWPADAPGGNFLVVDGVAATPVLVEDADTIDLGEEHQVALMGYALHAASFKKGGPFFEATLPSFQGFLDTCAEENGQIKTSQIYRKYMGPHRRDLQPLRDVSVKVGA